MISNLWTSVPNKWPIPPINLGIGLAIGISAGSFKLVFGNSYEVATMTGIAYYMAFAVGTWLGEKLSFWLLDAVKRHIATLSHMLKSVRVEFPDRDQQHSTTQSPNRNMKFEIMFVVSVVLPAYSLSIAPISVLIVLLDRGYDLFFFLPFWRYLAIVSVTVVALGLLVQRIDFARQKHQIRQLEKMVSELRELRTMASSEDQRQAIQDTERTKERFQAWFAWRRISLGEENFRTLVR